MVPPIISLPEVDEVHVQVIMENTVDVLSASTPVTRRPRVASGYTLRAEHGFAALVTLRHGGQQATVLLDAGPTPSGMANNLAALDITADDIQAIVLSHGHYDHTGGLPAVAERLTARGIPMVLHPDARLERKTVRPDGKEKLMPLPILDSLPAARVRPVEQAGPSLLADGLLLVSGEVARATAFEHGMPGHHAKRDGAWQPDPWVHDDQCLAANLRGRGLVIVTGCSHAGIINTVRHVQQLTGVAQVHAIIGGLHLAGPAFAECIAPTVAALTEIAPRYIVPGHCTGWAANHRLANALPDAFIPLSVGTTYVFSGNPSSSAHPASTNCESVRCVTP